MRRLTVGLLLALVAVLVAGCGDDGGDGGERQPLAGFEEVAFTVDGPGAAASARRCALLAATSAARARGLMGQDDLRGYDGMLFRFDGPRVASFYMYRTTIPLSIAWFGPDGSFVSSTDMDPCPADDASLCPSYAPQGVALHALEVAEGDLERLGIGPGTTLVVDDAPC